MKRIIGILFCFAFILIIGGCSSNKSGEKVNEILSDNGYISDMEYVNQNDYIMYNIYLTKDGKDLVSLEDNESYISIDIWDYDDDSKDVSTATYGVINIDRYGTTSADNYNFYSTSTEEAFKVEDNKALESSMINWLDSMSLSQDDFINYIEWKIEQIKK